MIAAVPRTGSKLLVEMLDSHPEILCHTEVFNPKSTYLSRKPDLSIGTKADRDRHPWEFLERLYSTTTGSKTVGFKIMPSHNNMVLLRLLLSRSVKKIILTRKHWLHAYVSNLYALATQQYHIRSAEADDTAKVGKPKPIHVDPARFRSYVRKIRAYYGAIKLLESVTRQRFFWLDYTEVRDSEAIVRLLRFLGVDERASLEIRLKKQGSADLSQRIQNFSDVRNSLRGTSWERLLEDELPSTDPSRIR